MEVLAHKMSVATHKGRGPTIDHEVREAIEARALKGETGAAIHRHLGSEQRFAGRVPSLRAVQQIIRRLTPRDPSGAWGLQAPGQDAAVNAAPVLAVVGWLIGWTDGHRLGVTRREAQWITVIAEAVPSVPPEWAYDLARRYLRAESEGRSWGELDRALALEPWANEERYRKAVEAGSAPRLLAPFASTRRETPGAPRSGAAPPAPEGGDDSTAVSGRGARPGRARPTGRTRSRQPTEPPKTEPPRPSRKLHLL